MEGYRRRPPGAAREDSESSARETLNEAGAFLRRLIPFPGSEALSPLTLLSCLAQGAVRSNSVANAAAEIVGQQAASIVSQAASILDEEMAKGVLAARGRPATAPTDSRTRATPWCVRCTSSSTISLRSGRACGAAGPARRRSSDSERSGSPCPSWGRATVKPGQRATISMTLCNSESRSVRLVPAATDCSAAEGRHSVLAARVHAFELSWNHRSRGIWR